MALGDLIKKLQTGVQGVNNFAFNPEAEPSGMDPYLAKEPYGSNQGFWNILSNMGRVGARQRMANEEMKNERALNQAKLEQMRASTEATRELGGLRGTQAAKMKAETEWVDLKSMADIADKSASAEQKKAIAGLYRVRADNFLAKQQAEIDALKAKANALARSGQNQQEMIELKKYIADQEAELKARQIDMQHTIAKLNSSTAITTTGMQVEGANQRTADTNATNMDIASGRNRTAENVANIGAASRDKATETNAGLRQQQIDINQQMADTKALGTAATSAVAAKKAGEPAAAKAIMQDKVEGREPTFWEGLSEMVGGQGAPARAVKKREPKTVPQGAPAPQPVKPSVDPAKKYTIYNPDGSVRGTMSGVELQKVLAVKPDFKFTEAK